jgi:hypothetical protein
MTVTSSKPGEGTVSPSSLTFDTANWTIPQTVTVTGVDDNVADGNIAYNIILGTITGTSAAYSGIKPANVAVTNQDNEAGGGSAIFSDGFEGN